MNDLFIPDCLFPTDNELEIPTFLIDKHNKSVDSYIKKRKK